MKLSPQEVQTRYNAGHLKIALIGMSNIGKSHLAKQLKDQFGFESIEVDRVIQSHLGKTNMTDHAAWLGQPYSQGYAARETEAIKLEPQATSEATDICLNGGNSILDAPGSVIYVDKALIDRIKKQFFCIYIKAAKADIERLKELYYTHPKPLIWNNSYKPELGDTPDKSVMASYDGLLRARATQYQALSDIILPASSVFSNGFDLGRAVGLTA